MRLQTIIRHNSGLFLIILVILASGFLTLFQLGSQALTDYDEATYALVIDETAESGQIGTLKIADDKYWFEKPPLYFWIAILIKDAFGPYQEWALRLPAALLGIASVIGVMLIAYHLRRDYYIAALSGAIIATVPIFMEASRQVRLDIPVAACIIFGFYCFLRGLERPWWLLGIGVFAAIGFLFKSVIGFFVFPLVLIWGITHRNYAWLKNAYFWISIGLMILLLIPWHLYETVTIGTTFWNEYLLRHVLDRFTSDIIGGTALNQNYLKYLFSFAAPWSIVFVLGMWNLHRYYKDKTDHDRDMLGLFAITIFIFVVFEVARTKIFYYLLPMFPFTALSVAFFLHDLYQGFVDRKSRQYAVTAIGVIFAVSFGYTMYVAFHHQEDLYVNQLIANEEKEVGLLIAAEGAPLETYTYKYPYLETIRYYGKGVYIDNMQDDQDLTESFNLIMHKEFYDVATFPPALEERFRILYEGEAVILLRFEHEQPDTDPSRG